MTETQNAQGGGFAHRVARTLATFLLAYSLFNLLQFVLYFAIEGVWWLGRYRFQRIEGALQMCRIAADVLLLAGAVGMRKWKPWSRRAVMTWAVAAVILSFASNITWLFEHLEQLRAAAATTRMVTPPLWKMTVYQLLWWIQTAFLPTLVWLILRHDEIGTTFIRVPSGGFEVVPTAQVAAAPDGGETAPR